MSRFEWKRRKNNPPDAPNSPVADGAFTPPGEAGSFPDNAAFSPLHVFQVHCDDYASLLTALFDGEAGEQEARIARLHLERCVRCAQMWRDWEKSQLLWRAMPEASVPPGLLLRVLTACRVASLGSKWARKTHRVRRVLAERVPPLAGLFPEVAPPPELREEILRRTVYAAATQAELRPYEYSHRGWATWASQISRWGVTVAVPASLMWMMFSGVSMTPTGMVEPRVVQRTATPAVAENEKSARTARVEIPLRVAASPEAPRASKSVVATAVVPQTSPAISPRARVAPEPLVQNETPRAAADLAENDVSTRIVGERLVALDAPRRDTVASAISAPADFASLRETSWKAETASLRTASLPSAPKAATRRVVTTSPRRATSRVKIERAVLRSGAVRTSARERSAAATRGVAPVERRMPAPSVSSPDVVLAAVPVRMAAAEPRSLPPTTALPEEVELDDENLRFAAGETENLRNILTEYQDSLLDEDMTS